MSSLNPAALSLAAGARKPVSGAVESNPGSVQFGIYSVDGRQPTE